jgi:hypothetical protein
MLAVKEKALLEWQVHLARRQPAKLLPTLGAIIAATLLMQIATHNPLLALATLLLLAFAAGEFLFPVHYRLTESGASARNLLNYRFLPWEQLRRCYRGPEGIKLSPLPYGGWREAFRGIQLRVEGAEQEKVAELINRLRPEQSRRREKKA